MINQERLVKTFCDLVKIDSPSGHEEALAQDLQRRLSALGFTCKRDAHGNLVASEKGDKPLLLSTHMDTVEPGRNIKPAVAGDRIVSDGATILGGDCKAGIAAVLEALASVKEDGAKRRPVQLLFTRGEEIGLVGARNLDVSLLTAREGFVFDGAGPVNTITTACPTYMSFDVRVKGRAAHAGVEPEKGLSAIRIASEVIARLPQGRIDSETTFNTATISGGTVRNAVPEAASFTGEFRSMNAAALAKLQSQLTGALDDARRRYADASIEAKVTEEYKGYSLSRDDPLIKRVTAVMASLGLQPDLRPSGGGTDGNILRGHGIPCVVVGMSSREMHTVREHVPIPDLLNVARFCQALLTSTA